MTRILVTNDDGIDAPGIAALVPAMAELGEVIVVAPDREFSGAGVSVGSLMRGLPPFQRRSFPGAAEAWAVSGPPAVCILYAEVGILGPPPDIVVSGINPGANIGRSVYHSGTLGACLEARNCGWSGVAVSQAAPTATAADGQAFYDTLGMQRWHVAAEVAKVFVGGLLSRMPADPIVANVNVPNVELADIAGWRLADVSPDPAARMIEPVITPREDDPDTFDVEVRWQRNLDAAPSTDTATVWSRLVSVSYVTRLVHGGRADVHGPTAALTEMLGPEQPVVG